MSSTPLVIPQIDITALLDNSSTPIQRQGVAVELLNAFTTYGVFYISSSTHPVFSNTKKHQILNATERLFALDKAHKDQIPRIQPGGFTRGFVPIGGESGSKTKELKEAFSYGYEWSSTELESKESLNGLQGPNVWPEQQALDQLDQDL
ncbi:hypothetical protein BGZ65_006945, partial [Modicella reniformis]